MERLTIELSKHYSKGNPHNPSLKPYRASMLDASGNRCCLGFIGDQIEGVSDKDILNREVPSDYSEWPEGLFVEHKECNRGAPQVFMNTSLTSELIGLNDSTDDYGVGVFLTYGERMGKMVKILQKHGIDTEFTLRGLPVPLEDVID